MAAMTDLQRGGGVGGRVARWSRRWIATGRRDDLAAMRVVARLDLEMLIEFGC